MEDGDKSDGLYSVFEYAIRATIVIVGTGVLLLVLLNFVLADYIHPGLRIFATVMVVAGSVFGALAACGIGLIVLLDDE